MNVDAQWGAYVDGRAVAVVCPAPAPHDQTSEIDVFDVVIRPGYTGGVPTGLGTRTTCGYYNITIGNRVRRGEWDAELANLDWLLLKPKTKPHPRFRCRHVPRPSGLNRPHQLPALLADLVTFTPKMVKVFGSDLYLGGPDNSYDAAYIAHGLGTRETVLRSLERHDEPAHHRFIADLFARHDVLCGDQRFEQIVAMSNAEYRKAFTEAWRLR